MMGHPRRDRFGGRGLMQLRRWSILRAAALPLLVVAALVAWWWLG